MTVTAIIATKDRPFSLTRTLESLLQVDVLPEHQLEILVVDNGDGSALTVASQLQAKTLDNKSLKAYCLAQPGKSRAINFGLDHTKADIVAMLDDDITVEQDWFHQIVDSFRPSEVYAVQGHIGLVETESIWWLTPRVQAIWAATSLIGPGQTLRQLIGSHMLVRNSDDLPRFCEQLGPGQPPYQFGEDCEWSARLLQRRPAIYCPGLRSFHHLEQRLSLWSTLERQMISGYNLYVFYHPLQRPKLYRECIGLLFSSLLKVSAKLFLGKPLRALDNLLDAARCVGCLSAPWKGCHRHPLWRSGLVGFPE